MKVKSMRDFRRVEQSEPMELDIEDFAMLQNYLSKRVEQSGTASFQKLLGGISNRTVQVTWPDGRCWVVKQALAKLRVSVDWFSSPDRIGVEAKALRYFNRLTPPGTTPAFIFADDRNHLLAMEAVPEGHENWKSVLLSGRIVPGHFEQFGCLLGSVHRKSSGTGADVRREFEDTRYFESLRLEPYYLYAAERTPAAAAFLTTLAQETLGHKISLVHGDFSPKNTLIYRGRLILLDYEVVHFGDPAFDVGFALAHFLSKAHHLRHERSRIANASALFWRVYCGEIASRGWADRVESRVVRNSLGCLLARVAGKSPLEYLTSWETARQREGVVRLIANPPANVDELIDRFLQEIETCAEN